MIGGYRVPLFQSSFETYSAKKISGVRYMNHGIVLGCPRSGTTYLMSVLNTVSEFECISGTLLPVAVPHVVNQDITPDVYNALAVGFERAIDAYLHSGRYHSRAGALQKWFRAPSGVKGLMQAIRNERPLPEVIIYKEPFLSFAPGFVLDALPDVRMIHIVRDGRDCANSLVRTYDVLTDERLKDLQGSEMRLGRKYDDRYVPWWVEEGKDRAFIDSTPYVRAIWMWKEMVRRCNDQLQQAKSGQVLEIRYEDFMDDPLGTGKTILHHFGVEKMPGACRKQLAKARKSSIGKHETRDQAEVEAAEQVAGRELQLYGYAEVQDSRVMSLA